MPLAQDSFLLEAGLDLALSPTATLGVSYTGQFAGSVSDNGLKGRFTWLFLRSQLWVTSGPQSTSWILSAWCHYRTF